MRAVPKAYWTNVDLSVTVFIAQAKERVDAFWGGSAYGDIERIDLFRMMQGLGKGGSTAEKLKEKRGNLFRKTCFQDRPGFGQVGESGALEESDSVFSNGDRELAAFEGEFVKGEVLVEGNIAGSEG